MSDPMTDGTVARCSWCSAPLPGEALETCPECGATLVGPAGSEPQLPGVTTLDAEAILRARSEVARPRSRLLSFITGEQPPAANVDPAARASLAPPTDAVRREMLRLQLAAELADLEAEVGAMSADAGLPPVTATPGLDDHPGAGGVAGAPEPTEPTPGTQDGAGA